MLRFAHTFFALGAMVLAGLFFSTDTASACPDIGLSGIEIIDADGGQLYTATGFSVVAGGDNSLYDCGYDASGYVISSPDFEFNLFDMTSYNAVVFRVEAPCDTVLFLNDARAEDYYNDDFDGLNPSISIGSPANGTYDVWVGTFDGSTCDAVLIVETF